MALNVNEVIENVHAHLKASVTQPVYEQGVPDPTTLRRDPSGKVPYYIAVQYGTPWARAKGKTFASVRNDDYTLPIAVQVVGPDATIVRKIALSGVLNALLGFSAPWTSQMEQRTGGSTLPMTQSTSATEAYVFPMGFGLTFQMDDA